MDFNSTIKIFIIILVFSINHNLFANTPVTLFDSYAGNVNFVGTQATRRTQANTGNACAVLSRNTTNTASITGIPAGATILAAHLYWAGSYSTQSGSTRTTPDYRIRFENSTFSAPSNRRYTSNYSVGSTSVDFFSGVADVTSKVITKRNGTYSFKGLSVNTAAQHCSSASVLAGWSLIVIYEDSSEDFRVVNLFEGFQAFRYQNITLTPNNFKIPTSPINGKIAHITWEGDTENSASGSGFSEQLTLNGNTLSDTSNPINNQFNSTSTAPSASPSTGSTDSSSYGVDFDFYDISSYLNAGDTSATSTYSSGADLVILSSEIISVTNTPVSDLAISKTHVDTFEVGQNEIYNIVVSNNGPIIEAGPIVVIDTLPAGLTFVSATGTDWSCSASGQVVTCTRVNNLAVSNSTPTITLTVLVSATASPSVTNTATVSGNNFDNIASNNSSSDTVAVTVSTTPIISLQKTSVTLSDPINNTTNPKAIPGALAEYTLKAVNSGGGAADNNTIILSDSIPANTALYVNDISGSGTGPVRFVDGAPPSGLSYSFVSLASTTDDVSFSNNSGTSYNYTPSADADGVDTTVTNIKMATQGSFLGDSGSGAPNFLFKFRVKVK